MWYVIIIYVLDVDVEIDKKRVQYKSPQLV